MDRFAQTIKVVVLREETLELNKLVLKDELCSLSREKKSLFDFLVTSNPKLGSLVQENSRSKITPACSIPGLVSTLSGIMYWVAFSTAI
jgi:hypothetical protein